MRRSSVALDREARRRPIHERRDVVCCLAFVPAATIAAINLWLYRFETGFWISLAIAVGTWMLAYRKWAPVTCLFAFVTVRFGVTSLVTGSLRDVAISAACGILTAAILWLQRNDE